MNIFDLQATISLNGADFKAGVQEAQGAFQNLGQSVGAGTIAVGQMIGNFATKAAGELIGFGKESLQTGMNFDAAMSNVKAISGATGEEFESLRDKAKEMGATTKFTATESAEAFQYMAMAGWDAEQMLSGIEGIMNLAAASGESLGTTSDIVTDALTAFGLSAADSGHFADVLAATSAAANTNVSMLGETFKYVAPLAGTMGYSVEDMATAIGTMANSGIKGGQAGTALRAALTRLVKPTKQVSDAMGALGLDGILTDSAGNMREFSDVVETLRDAFSGLSEAEQAEYGAMIFGQEAMSGMLAILNTSAEEYNKLADRIGGASDAMGGIGAAAEMASTQLDNLQGDVTIFSSALDGFKTAVYDKIKEPLRDAVQFGAEALSAMTEGFNNNGLAGAVTALGATIKEKLTGIWDGLNLPPWVEQIGERLGAAFESIKDAIGRVDLKGKFRQIGDSIREGFEQARESAAQVDWGGMFGGLKEKVGAAIDAIKPELQSKIETIKGVFGDLRNAFSSIAEAGAGVNEEILPGFMENVGKLLGSFKQFGDVKFDAITTGISDFANAFVEVDIGDTIANIARESGNFFSSLAGASADVISGVSGAVSEFIDGFRTTDAAVGIAQIADDAGNLFAKFIGVSGDIISDVGDGVANFIDAFPSEGVGEVIGDMTNHISALFGEFAKTSGTLISEVGDAVHEFIAGFDNESAGSIIGTVADSVGNLFGHFTDTLGSVIRKIGEGFEGFGTKIGEVWNTAGPNLSDLADTFEDVGEVIGGVVDGVMKVLGPVISWFTDVFVVAIQAGIDIIVRIFGGLVNAVGGVVKAVVNALKGIWEFLTGDLASATEAFKDAWEGIKRFFIGLFDVIKAPFVGLWEILSDAGNKAVQGLKKPFEKIGEWFKDIGGKIVDGIKSGISAAWSGLTSWLSDKVNGLVDGVKGIFGIHSPSRVFAEIGSNLVLGLREGWGDSFGGLESQVYRDMNALTESTSQLKFEDSALGRSSAAEISSMLAASEYGGRGEPVEINLMLDGDVAARALYDPMQRVIFQRGTGDTRVREVMAYA